jgi:hypothetical protein
MNVADRVVIVSVASRHYKSSSSQLHVTLKCDILTVNKWLVDVIRGSIN